MARMNTQEMIDHLEQEMSELKTFVRAIVPLDTEGENRTDFARAVEGTRNEKPGGLYMSEGGLLCMS